MGLIAFCRSCGREVATRELREGVCLDCRVSEAVADLREEHLRLSRKRERYLARGVPAESVGRQLARLEERIAERIGALVPDREQAARLLHKELERARRSRYDIRRA